MPEDLNGGEGEILLCIDLGECVCVCVCVLGVGGRGTFCARIKMRERGMETNHGNMHFVGVRFLVLFVGGITVMERQGCDTVRCPAFTPTPPPTMFCLSLFSFLFVTDLPNVCCLKCKCVVLCISLCVVGGGGRGACRTRVRVCNWGM